MDTLGSRLKEAREKKRLTQVQVAEKLGISNGTLSGYERNYRDPDTSTLSELSKIYEVSIDYLTNGVVTLEKSFKDTEMEKEQKYALELFNKITDKEKKKAAFEVLKGLAGEK
ncbi:helix-turn-helix domain-containing protein [Paenibacillus oryzisoli]|uniref:HTH cro/C1-type domain-containing protein n=1 Tax=Paenibacillus oryzisoli TaxID=1850517 RepID=A0A198AE04_9BACL|nr:helix-turn-helix transcriptional regulator [Paenibacillus oryzisoli]OAS19286.1 hypothetical protein A8708_26620 [Paenibacillus oryzisoli]